MAGNALAAVICVRSPVGKSILSQYLDEGILHKYAPAMAAPVPTYVPHWAGAKQNPAVLYLRPRLHRLPRIP